MLVKVIAAFCLLVMVSYTTAFGSLKRGEPAEVTQAQAQYEALRVFALSVKDFVKANPAFEGTLTWRSQTGTTALDQQVTTPPGLRATALPSSWRAIVPSHGDYVLCAGVSPSVVRIIAAQMPSGSNGHVVENLGTDYVVFDRQDDAEERAAPCAAL